MRVALVTTGLGYGGAERIVQALAEDLEARGCSVLVVATTRGGPIADALSARGIGVSVLGLRHAFDARVPLALARVMARHGTELVHSHLAVADLAVSMATRLGPKTARVCTVHNPGVELSPAKAMAWRLALRRFHRVLAVSEHVRDRLPAGLPATVLHPSLVDRLAPETAREKARAALGLREHELVVMAVGRLVPIKGFDLLLRARGLITRTDARFLLIGSGPEREALAGGGLELLGEREDAAELVAAADILVCPSRSEGFPQAPLHANAAGVPVVATAVGGQSEVVLDLVNGLLVGPDNPVALARALSRLLEDAALRRALGQRARDRILARGLFRDVMVDQTLEAYREARMLARTGKVLETALTSR